MKKNTLLIAFIFLSFNSAKAQFVDITSVSTSPSMLSDTEHVKAIISAQFGSGGCPLVNSTYYLSNDTVLLMAYYQLGMLTVICNTTDTIDLGLLPCTMHTLHVQALVLGGSNTDHDFHPIFVNCTAVGVPELSFSNDFLVFPNPASGELNVKVKGEKNSLVKISIFNLLGGKIYSSIDLQIGKEFVKRIDAGSFAKGFYLIKVESKNGSRIKKFLKE